MFDIIIKDMSEPISYLPLGAFSALVFILVFFVFEKILFKLNFNLKKYLVIFLFFVYIAVILQLAFFSREPGSRKGIDFVLFSTWGKTLRTKSYFIENVLMFIPFGIMFPLISKKLNKILITLLCGCFCSICLELMQLFTQRGFCQLDDVVTNTFGTFIGWCIFAVFHIFYLLIKKEKS